MSATSSASTTATNKHSNPLLLILIAAGLAGNYFNYPIFLNIDFLFGSIFALLALQFFGLGRGILSAAAIAAYTWVLWNHPYAIIVLSAEVAVVGWLIGRRKIGMVLADTLYWLVIGMPLVYLFYNIIMQVPPSSTYITMTKQALNGIANALVARLIFTGYARLSRSSLTSYRETIYNLLAFFVLCPALLMLAVSSRTDFRETDLQIRSLLMHDSQNLAYTLKIWEENRKTAIINLAEMAAVRSPEQMQSYLEIVRKSDPNFLRVGLLDREGTTIAYFPLVDELGGSNIGKNFADRPFIPSLKQTLKPMLSEVVMGKIGTPRPRVSMLVPVVKSGGYGGFVVGVLELEQIRDQLDKSLNKNGTIYTLIDKNSNVIMSSRSDQTVMKPFARGKGTLTRLDEKISQWLPYLQPNSPASERWQKSYFIAKSDIGALSEWKLILEQPVAPFQKVLYDSYTGKLMLLFLILLAALAMAEFISRLITATLDKLCLITHDIPTTATPYTSVNWPESGIQETNNLISNFREMSKSIQQHLDVLEYLNDSLEQRVAERTRQLEKITQELRIILENAPVGISKMIDRKQIWVNRKVEEMIMYSKEELKFQTVRQLYPSDEAYEKLGQEAYPLLAQGLVFESEQVLVRKDGVHILVRYIGKALDPSDMPKGTIWMVEDITERKRAETELQEANRFSEQIIRNAQEGVIVYDRGLRYRVWNPFMEKITGMTADEVLGRHPSELFPFLQAAGIIERLEMVLSGEEMIVVDFPYAVQQTGNSGWASDQLGPLRNVKGEIIGVISTVREISERKRLDDELHQALENARSTNFKMSRLLRTVAHEFRTPLGLLTGSADIRDRYWERLSPEKRREQNEYIRSAARQLSDMITSVISFNQLETDRSGNLPQLLDIREVCSRIAAEVQAVWGSGLKLNISIATDCGSAMLDETAFRRVLENLLTNAFRYTPLDGIVSLIVQRENSRLCLEISDSGIGIPEDDLALIFDAFYRSRNVEGRRGLGLGLSIVHESLSQMGGIITVNSRVGEGTTMRVEIPID